MRLKPEEITILKEAVLRFDPNSRVFLFGSRVDSSKKGGDIDLLVLSNSL
jgi:predicted nucleotidyltransferase